MGVALARCPGDAFQHGTAFAPVAGEDEYTQPRLPGRKILKLHRAPVGTAIDHDPDRLPLLTGRRDGFENPRSGVVARDENQMGGGADGQTDLSGGHALGRGRQGIAEAGFQFPGKSLQISGWVEARAQPQAK